VRLCKCDRKVAQLLSERSRKGEPDSVRFQQGKLVLIYDEQATHKHNGENELVDHPRKSTSTNSDKSILTLYSRKS